MAEPTPTIYSFYAPETEQVVRQTLQLLNIGGVNGIHSALQQNYLPGLDEFHLPLMSKFERFARSEGVIGLNGFDHKYFTNGSSEGIFHLITSLLPAEKLYQFKGEYQGYSAYADSIGREIITVKDTGELMARDPGVLIVSAPTSRDGSLIPNWMLREWGRKHNIIVDLAYMGATMEPLDLDLTNPSVMAVVGSLSKSFGMYYYRVGFCYSRFSIKSLYGNMWFKNALSIKLGEAILDHFDPIRLEEFKTKYFAKQANAVERANVDLGLAATKPIKPSPVWLLGCMARDKAKKYDPEELRPFKRVDGWNDHQPTIWRFCLTPYYMEERHNA